MGDFRFGQKWKWLGIAGFFLLLVNLLFFGHHLSERDFGTIRSVSRNYMQLLDENQGKNYRELFEKLQDEEIAYSTPEDYKKLRNMDVTSTEALLLYRENLDYLIHFREQYASVAANAKSMGKFQIFSREGSFAQKNIEKTVQDYGNVRDVPLSLVNGRSLESFIEFKDIDIVVFIVLMSYLYYNVFWFPEEMKGLVFSLKKGRWHEGLWQAFLRAIAVAAVVLIFYGSIFFDSVLLYGRIGDFGASIQSISIFSTFCYGFTIFRVILQIFVLKFALWFLILEFTVGLWIFFRNVKVTFAAVLFAAVFQYIFWNMDLVVFPMNLLKYMNVWFLLDVKGYYCEYLNIHFMNHPVSSYAFAVAAIFILCGLFMAVTIIGYSCLRPVRKAVEIFPGFLKRVKLPVMPLFVTEAYKVMWTQKGILILAAFVWLEYNEFQKTPVQFSTADSYINYLYKEFGGTPEEERLQELYDMQTELQVKNEENEVSVLVQQLAGLDTFIGRYEDCLRQKDEGYSIGLVNPAGFNKLVVKENFWKHVYSCVKAIVFMALLLIQMNMIEYRTGVNRLMHTSRNGERLVRKNKGRIIWLTVIAALLLFFGTEWLETGLYYPISGMEYSLRSLPACADSWYAGPIWGYFAALYGIKAAVVIGAGVLLKNKTAQGIV